MIYRNPEELKFTSANPAIPRPTEINVEPPMTTVSVDASPGAVPADSGTFLITYTLQPGNIVITSREMVIAWSTATITAGQAPSRARDGSHLTKRWGAVRVLTPHGWKPAFMETKASQLTDNVFQRPAYFRETAIELPGGGLIALGWLSIEAGEFLKDFTERAKQFLGVGADASTGEE